MVNFIICEFNPFHNGHDFLLQSVHEYPNVCIMSGHITERGSFAVTDKWARTEMALRSGADLVLELPSPFILGSAESFAKGAVDIIKATGLPGRLCFGTEGEALSKLQTLAEISEEQLSCPIKQGQKEGLSYAAAAQNAYRAVCPEYADILQSPNNLLALEYLKAAPGFPAYAVPRKGAAHDTKQCNGKFCSAAALRENLNEYQKYTPKEVHGIYRDILDTGTVFDQQKFDIVCLHALRMLTAEQWEQIAPGGIGQRFYKAVSHAKDTEALLNEVKTKCCTHASLRRLMLKAFLGQPPVTAPQYIRLLGCNALGRQLLKEMTPSLPVLTKPAAVKNMNEEAQKAFLYDRRITDSFCYCLKTPKATGAELVNSPILHI